MIASYRLPWPDGLKFRSPEQTPFLATIRSPPAEVAASATFVLDSVLVTARTHAFIFPEGVPAATRTLVIAIELACRSLAKHVPLKLRKYARRFGMKLH